VQVWKKLWKLKIPAKIKIFGWRALKGLVPCNAILANRHIIPNGGCPVCNGGAEDVKHIILSCDHAKAVWKSIGMWNRINTMLDPDHSGSVVLQEVIQRGEHVQELDIGLAELILTGGWYLWWERRKITHGENVSRPARSDLTIVSLTKNFKMAEGKGLRIRQGWRKPPEGYIMINIDASYDENEGCGSTGVVIRDSSGGMIAATNTYIPHLVDTQMAEAYALKEGLMLAQHIGGNRLIFQSDCMEVVEVMKNGGFTANSAAAIYDECITVWGGIPGNLYSTLKRGS